MWQFLWYTIIDQVIAYKDNAGMFLAHVYTLWGLTKLVTRAVGG
jgi:hypothetical protein